ncbi:MAG: acyl-CoA synthetase [Vicinamibacterales bacterium]
MTTSKIAIVDRDGAHTYADLDGASSQVAGALLQGAEDLAEARVAYFVAPGFSYAAVQRGIWRAGGVAVPMALSHPRGELEYVIADSGASIVVADESAAAMLRPLAEAAGARFLTTAEALTWGPAAFAPGASAGRTSGPFLGANRRAMIIYTSGTTGRPKGVVTSHANIGAQVSSLVEAWGWQPSDCLLLVLPLHHVHGVINGLCSALAVHATVEMPPSVDATAVWERLASGEVTVFTAVPTIYHRLIGAWDGADAATRERWSGGVCGLRLMMSGSAALPVQTLERWRQITGHTLLERYGMTEIGMALSNPLDGERRPGFVGQPLPGVEVRLVDGELEVRGPTVFKEYWQRPEETQAAFHDGWFRTGDVAVEEDGSYRLLGRTSVDIIKTGGFKVSALEIEAVLRDHPAIAECAVVGVPDEEWGERVAAAVELRPGSALPINELQAWARDRLAPYKLPRALMPVGSLPRNAMGKVVKPDVRQLFQR